jgi:hypothetical protein
LDQHVISGWLLRAFARGGRDRQTLAVYDKVTGRLDATPTEDFMVELDAHSPQVERGIGRIETPASQAGRALAKRVRHLPPGLYAVVAEGAATRSSGPDLSDEGLFEGIRLLVGRREIGAPSRRDRLALATFVGLMYQRAPKTERSIRAWGAEFDRGAQWSLDRLLPGMKSGLGWQLEHRRARMLALSGNVGQRLADSTWWILRASDDQSFVLGDSPVVATVSLGHDDGWRAILADESNVLAMPLAPGIALLLAPRAIMPVSRIELADAARAVNRLSWRWAERFVVARDPKHLETVLATMDEAERRASVDASVDGRRVFLDGVSTVTQICMQLEWRRWKGCRPIPGMQPFPPEDRNLFAGPGAHTLPTKPFQIRYPTRESARPTEDSGGAQPLDELLEANDRE